MSKKILYLLLITFSLLSCKSEKKQETIFQISGNIMGFENEIFSLVRKEKDTYKIILTAKKDNTSFIIKSLKKLTEGLYYLQVGNNNNRIPLFIDNTDILIYLNNIDLSKTHVDSNSKIQLTYYNFLKGSKQTTNLFAYQKRFIEENKSNLLSAIVLKDMLGNTAWRLEQTESLYNQLDNNIKSGNLGLEISQYIENGLKNITTASTASEENVKKEAIEEIINIEDKQNKTTPTETNVSKESIIIEPAITEYAPYFFGNGLDGNEMSAKNIFSKNKLTLIDFWASWCRPCRAQNPDLVRLYNKYHAKGFDILSVAEDKKDSNWKNAIMQDNMTWNHINDDYKRIATMYKISTIPHAILVNNQGGIISKKVSSTELERLLINEFGY